MPDMPPVQFADVNGVRMAFYEAGPKSDALPLVLCHGWPEIAYSWRHQIKALSAAGYRVIAPDQRGYGATDRPDRVEDYDLEHLTGDLAALLDHLKIDKAIFVGHDWGGFVVWQMAMRHPLRVAGVVSLNTPPQRPRARRSDPDLPQAVRRQHVYRAVPKSGARAGPDLRRQSRKIVRLLHARPPARPRAAVEFRPRRFAQA